MAALVIAVVLICAHIRYTYVKVGEQKRQIEALTHEVENAKNAIRFQNDLNKAWGRIDDVTYKNISTILNKPVPRVIGGGVL